MGRRVLKWTKKRIVQRIRGGYAQGDGVKRKAINGKPQQEYARRRGCDYLLYVQFNTQQTAVHRKETKTSIVRAQIWKEVLP